MDVDRLDIERFNPFGASAEELLAFALDDAGLLGAETTISGRPGRVFLEAFYRKREQYREATRVGDLLVRDGIITQEQLRIAVGLQRGNLSKLLGEALVEIGACAPEDLESVLSTQSRIRSDLENLEQHRQRVIALRERIVPLSPCQGA